MRALAAFALAALVAPAAIAQAAPVRTVSSAEYSARPSGKLIDVREPAEWTETGVPKGAATISISRADFVDAVTKEVGGDRTKPVAVICKSGNRSVRAAETLRAAGFTNVTNVADGMMGREGVGAGWLASKLPTQPHPAN